MNTQRNWNWSAMVLAALAMIAFSTSPAWAKGGGGHGGGGGGGHHAGGGGHHGGEHHANHHPYHPSKHHEEHHASHHDDHHDGHPDDHHVAHHNHHHENWHHGNWGPGYWGGYGGYAYAPWGWGGDGGGDTYVDDSTNVTPASNDYADNESGNSDNSSTDNSSDDQSSASDSSSDRGFPSDDWPELGVVTYAGEYGALQGQVIVRVVPGSAASKAGFVPGDVILSLNGQPVPSADDLDTVLDHATGEFSAEVWDARTGRKSTVSGKLDANAPATTETASFGPQP